MPAAPTLVTARLTLRQPQAGDLPAYVAYCGSDRTRFVGGPYDAIKAFEKLAAMIGHWTLRGFGRYVIDLAGQPIGHVGPMALDDSDHPELTWTLWDAAQEGHGYATEAAQAVAHHLLDDLHWPGLVIHIVEENGSSRRIAERLGARLTDEPAPVWLAGCVTYRLGKGGTA